MALLHTTGMNDFSIAFHSVVRHFTLLAIMIFLIAFHITGVHASISHIIGTNDFSIGFDIVIRHYTVLAFMIFPFTFVVELGCHMRVKANQDLFCVEIDSMANEPG